jgi:hypothetical protein
MKRWSRRLETVTSWQGWNKLVWMMLKEQDSAYDHTPVAHYHLQ